MAAVITATSSASSDRSALTAGAAVLTGAAGTGAGAGVSFFVFFPVSH